MRSLGEVRLLARLPVPGHDDFNVQGPDLLERIEPSSRVSFLDERLIGPYSVSRSRH
jgi:hypothetical protein